MQEYNAEQTLMLLTLLGKHGTNVFEKFLRALARSGHKMVVDELKRTERNTKFGRPTYPYPLHTY